MSKEILQAIKAICDEKHIPVNSVLSTIEQALAAAYRKDFGNKMQNLRVKFNPETMETRIFDVKEVVEDMELDEEGNIVEQEEEKENAAQENQEPTESGEDQKPEDSVEKKQEQGQEAPEDKKSDGNEGGIEASRKESPEKTESENEETERFNPKTQIMLSDAKNIKPDIKVGDELVQELEVSGDFGRMAAQTAKQVIIQRLREAEREVVFSEYKDKEGQLISGTVQRVESGNVLVDIGQATAIMPSSEQVRGEHYTSGSQFRFYIKSVSTSNKGPEVIVSRTDKELVKKLFEMEVPEISDGSLELKSVAREPGFRSKIAVYTEEENIDPVGSCVGQRGNRVQFIINELGGEKIDIIEWSGDSEEFIKNALSPAKILEILFDTENKTAQAVVASDQFSLAIGKQGQNVRLASALTGWKIDIKQSQESGENEEEKEFSQAEQESENAKEDEHNYEAADNQTDKEESGDKEAPEAEKK